MWGPTLPLPVVGAHTACTVRRTTVGLGRSLAPSLQGWGGDSSLRDITCRRCCSGPRVMAPASRRGPCAASAAVGAAGIPTGREKRPPFEDMHQRMLPVKISLFLLTSATPHFSTSPPQMRPSGGPPAIEEASTSAAPHRMQRRTDRARYDADSPRVGSVLDPEPRRTPGPAQARPICFAVHSATDARARSRFLL